MLVWISLFSRPSMLLVIYVLSTNMRARRVLVVAPKMLLGHWMKELTVVGLSSWIREYCGTSLRLREYELQKVFKILKKICDHPLLLTKRAAEAVLEGMDTMLNREELGMVEEMALNLANMSNHDDILKNGDNENLIKERHHVLIFSQTRKMLNLVQRYGRSHSPDPAFKLIS
ncbi:hypothetical protein HPP92_000091 [Vanilla planifolia]|uniref:Uncharacterized protein n=1 Tax=Vanilla planifolia TaxID=51239 RepID=A0A835VFS1_VANPL|nr:hypothetical protein HPP92_000091 [Vanilla planifolia]